MPSTVIYANVLPFIASFFVMLFMRINPLFDRKQNKMFLLSSVTMMFMLVVISTDYTVSLHEPSWEWIVRRVTSFLNFGLSCTVPIFLIEILTRKRMKLALYIPAIINILLCGASIFVNLVFYFPKNGSYERGPLFFIPFATTLFYIFYLIITFVRKRNEHPYEGLFLFGVILGLGFAMYLEVIGHYKFLTWDFAAIFLMLYYLLLNINKSKLDPLTGANNRAMYVQKIESINHARQCLIAMIDINGFKAVNDQKGHDEGDRLLIEFVAAAKLFMDKRNVLYRIGGDEFAVISNEESMDAFEKLMKAFFAKLKEHDINCAVGFESYDPSVDIEDTIHLADMKMYEDKRRYYSQKAISLSHQGFCQEELF